MKIATFNLRNLFGPGEHNILGKIVVFSQDLVKKRITYIVGLLDKLDADVIILNEIGSPELLDIIAKELGMQSFVASTQDKRGICNGALYRDQKTLCESFVLTPSLPLIRTQEQKPYNGDLLSKRNLVRLTSHYLAKPLHIIGLHFKSSLPTPLDYQTLNLPTRQADYSDGLIRSSLRRLAEARALRLKLDELFTHEPNAQVVIAGDFNDDLYSTTVSAVQGGLDASGKLLNLMTKIPLERRFSTISKYDKRVLDHILVSTSLEPYVTKVQIFNDDLKLELDYDDPLLIESDHAPVLFELQY